MPKKPNLDKFKVNPINIIDNATNKIENFYSNFKFEKYKSCFDTNKKINITKFIRVKIKDKTAYEHNSSGSAKLISTAQSDGFMIVEEGISKVVKGRSYPVIKFEI